MSNYLYLKSEIAKLKKRSKEIQRQLDKLADSIEEGNATKTTNRRIREQEAESEIVESKLEELQEKLDLLPDPTEVIEQAKIIEQKLLEEYHDRDWRMLPMKDIRAFLELHFGPPAKGSPYGIFVTPVKPNEKKGLTISDGKKTWHVDIRGRFDAEELLKKYFTINEDSFLSGSVSNTSSTWTRTNSGRPRTPRWSILVWPDKFCKPERNGCPRSRWASPTLQSRDCRKRRALR